MLATTAKKTLLITGCSLGGIGDALAQAFHRKGFQVFATARDLSKVQHLKEMGLTVLPLDVVDLLSIKSALESIKKATSGTLDILVNNAGIGGIAQPLGTYKIDGNMPIAMIRLFKSDFRRRPRLCKKNYGCQSVFYRCCDTRIRSFAHQVKGHYHQYWQHCWSVSVSLARDVRCELCCCQSLE